MAEGKSKGSKSDDNSQAADALPSAAEAAESLRGVTKVRVPQVGKDGKPVQITDVNSPDKGKYVMVERDATAADILDVKRRADGRVVIVTVDGQKFVDGQAAA